MPWVNECKWTYTKGTILKTIGTLRWKQKNDEWIGENDAEVDVYIACKELGLDYSYKNIERITDWLNGKREIS